MFNFSLRFDKSEAEFSYLLNSNHTYLDPSSEFLQISGKLAQNIGENFRFDYKNRD